MTLMEKYKEEAIRDANIKAVVNMLLIGADEKKVKEFYPDVYEEGKQIFNSERKNNK